MKDNYRRREEPKPMEENEGQLEGRNALTEALRSGRTIDKVFIASGDTDRALQRLAADAKEAGAVVVPVDRRKLDAMSTTRSHQGIIALAAAHEYFTIDHTRYGDSTDCIIFRPDLGETKKYEGEY